MDNERTKRHTLITAIENERQSKLISYILSPHGASVADDALPPLYHQLLTIGYQERLDLLISARGGSPESVWRVLSLLREHTNHLAVLLPGQLFSASAFIALGADEVVMSPLSELGPMHIQTIKGPPNEETMGKPQLINPFDIHEFFNFAHENGVDPDQAADMLNIEGSTIGSAMRAVELARHVCRKALLLSKSIKSDEQIENIIDLFTYKSHSSNLPFTRRDCIEELELPVTKASQTLERNMGTLLNHYIRFTSERTVPERDPATNVEAQVVTPAILESTRLTLVHRRKIEIASNGQVKDIPGWGGWIDDTVQEVM